MRGGVRLTPDNYLPPTVSELDLSECWNGDYYHNNDAGSRVL